MKFLVCICCVVFLCLVMPFLIPFAFLGAIIAAPICAVYYAFASYRDSGDRDVQRELNRRMLAQMRGQPYRRPRRLLLGLWDRLGED